jgi:hypothetical protein
MEVSMKVTTDFPKVSYSEGTPEDFISQWDANEAALEAQSEAAVAAGTLVGRYIREGVADGHATYVIVKENKTTVRIHHVTGLGDDYWIQYWGKEASIPKAYALQKLKDQDSLAELFGRHPEMHGGK